MSSAAATASAASAATRNAGSGTGSDSAGAAAAASLEAKPSGQTPAKTARTKWSKPKKGKTAYNFLFSEERLRILAERDRQDGQGGSKGAGQNEPCDAPSVAASDMSTSSRKTRKKQPHGKISFQELGSEISRRWKLVSLEDMARYDAMAREDAIRYRKEMEEYETEKMAAMYMLQSDMMVNRNAGVPQLSAAASTANGTGGSAAVAPPAPVFQQHLANNNMNAMYQPMPPRADHMQSVPPGPQMQTQTQASWAPAQAQASANTEANVALNFQVPANMPMSFATSFAQQAVAAPPSAQIPQWPTGAQFFSGDTPTANAQTMTPNQGQQQQTQYHVFSGTGNLTESQVQQITQALQQQMHQQGGTIPSSAPASIPFGFETASSSITSSQTLPAALLERLTSTSGNSSSSSSPFFPVSNQGTMATSLPVPPRPGGQMPSSMAVTVNASTVSSSSSGTTTKTETATATIGGRQVPVRIHHHNHYVTISEETGEVEVRSSSSSSDEKEGIATSTSRSRSRSRSRSSNKSMENDSLSSMSTLTSIKLSVAPQKKKDDSSLSDISTSTAELKYSNIEAGRLPPRKRRSPSSSASAGEFSSCSNSSGAASSDSSSVDSSNAVCGVKRAKIGED